MKIELGEKMKIAQRFFVFVADVIKSPHQLFFILDQMHSRGKKLLLRYFHIIRQFMKYAGQYPTVYCRATISFGFLCSIVDHFEVTSHRVRITRLSCQFIPLSTSVSWNITKLNSIWTSPEALAPLLSSGLTFGNGLCRIPASVATCHLIQMAPYLIPSSTRSCSGGVYYCKKLKAPSKKKMVSLDIDTLFLLLLLYFVWSMCSSSKRRTNKFI